MTPPNVMSVDFIFNFVKGTNEIKNHSKIQKGKKKTNARKNVAGTRSQ